MKTHHLGEDVVLLSRQIFFHIGDGPYRSSDKNTGWLLYLARPGSSAHGVDRVWWRIVSPKKLGFSPRRLGF